MGTILFWAVWGLMAVFYSVTTRKQRQEWFWLAWTLAIGAILIASMLNAAKQGYVTYL